MPAGNNAKSSYIYYEPFEGQWERKLKNGPIEGSHSRKNKNGKTIEVIHDDYVQGYIHKIQKEDSGEYGWSLIVTIREFESYKAGEKILSSFFK